MQAILLVEAGYEVPEIAIYYAAEERRVVVPSTTPRAEALATLDAAKQAARGPRPLPLLNDPRCPRCSLLPICLPDEVHQQRGDGPPALPATRRLWPPRNEGLHLVAQRRGTRIGVHGAAMTVSDESGAKTHDVPLANLESLSLLGGVQISTQAITRLKRKAGGSRLRRSFYPLCVFLLGRRGPPTLCRPPPPSAGQCPGTPHRGGHLPSVRCQTISETLVIPCHHLMCSRSGFRIRELP